MIAHEGATAYACRRIALATIDTVVRRLGVRGVHRSVASSAKGTKNDQPVATRRRDNVQGRVQRNLVAHLPWAQESQVQILSPRPIESRAYQLHH